MTIEIDTLNRFMVAKQGDHLCVMRAPALGVVTRDEALNLAAWLVAMADVLPSEAGAPSFEDVLAAVRVT